MRVSALSAVGITRHHRPERDFELVRRSFLRDATVSLKAFRVGAYVLSHADGFVQTQAQIARGVGLSVTTVRAALVDLERHRYVARRRIREAGRWIGTAYAVSDRPFTDEELAILCPPCTESEHSDPVHTESDPRKKTTPVRETITSKKTHPSGGSLREPDPTSTEEDDMPPTPTGTLPLDLGLPEPERPDPKPKNPSAADVVAAYVDSFRQHHSGGNPLRSEIGRVSRDAKALIVAGRGTVAELVAAATAMGSGPFCNLGVQLNITRDRRAGTRGAVPASGSEVFQDASDSAEADFAARLHVDEELASWVAEDPEAVRRYVAMDATLEPVFARLTAA